MLLYEKNITVSRLIPSQEILNTRIKSYFDYFSLMNSKCKQRILYVNAYVDLF